MLGPGHKTMDGLSEFIKLRNFAHVIHGKVEARTSPMIPSKVTAEWSIT